MVQEKGTSSINERYGLWIVKGTSEKKKKNMVPKTVTKYIINKGFDLIFENLSFWTTKI